jgi:molybdate transport system regulatory protein
MRHSFSIANKLEIERSGICFLNPKRIELLKLIRERGSILSASKELRMSYQQAWTIIKDVNYLASLPVVVRQRGGAKGGGASITDYGLKLMERYEILSARFTQRLADLNDDVQMLCIF